MFIQGFKSFCDATELLFDEEGITAVVGPNGCGKSNVADAISWVIGEQRAKALRGGKMEDVIFQGSKNRQPSGMAEVILTMMVREPFEIRGDAPITTPSAPGTVTSPDPSSTPLTVEDSSHSDEVDSILLDSPEVTAPELTPPIQFVKPDYSGPTAPKKKKSTSPPGLPRVFAEGERITIGRRLYRTGESEYEMNGRQCRLRDVQDLFAGTGLGGAHYAIIEQGRIGQVLSAKPLDRRALIEEAAGVSKFKMRQHAAEMKLDAAKQNLSRVNDILSEIERQQNSLRRQAGKARRFRKLQQEMRDLMRAIFVVDYRGTRGEINTRESTLAALTAQESAILVERSTLEDEQLLLAQAAKTADLVLNETRQAANTIDIDLERARQQITFSNDQIQKLVLRRVQTEQERNSIVERNSFLEQEAGRLRSELQKTEEEINAENQALIMAEEEHRTQSQQDLSAEAALEEKRRLAYESLSRLDRWRQLTRQFTESLQRSTDRLNGLLLEKERALEQSSITVTKYDEVQFQVSDLELRQAACTDHLEELKVSLYNQRKSRDEMRDQLISLEREITASTQRLQSLRELDQRRAYFSESVQAIVKEGQTGSSFRVLGTLADFVSVAESNEGLVERALSDVLQYLVVPTCDDAFRAIQFLDKLGSGRANFIISDQDVPAAYPAAERSSAQSSDVQTLGSLLGLHTEISTSIRLAFPELLNAPLIDGLTSSDQYPPLTTLVTRGGEKIISRLLVTGGSQTENGTGILAVKREIEELARRLSTQEDAAVEISQQLESLNHDVEKSEEELLRLDAELRQFAMNLAVLREQLIQCQRERERAATHIRVVEQEAAQALVERDDFDSRLNHAREEMNIAEESRTIADQSTTQAQEELSQLRGKAEERGEALSRRRADFAMRTERRRGFINDLRRLDNEIQTLNNRIGRLDFEDVEITENLTQARMIFEVASGELTDLNTRREQISLEFEERSNHLANTRERLEQLEQTLREVRDNSTLVREQRAQVEIDLAKLSANLEFLIQSCHSELGEDLIRVCEQLDQLSATKVTTTAAGKQLANESEHIDADDEDLDLSDSSNDIRFWYVPSDFNLEIAKKRLTAVNERIDSLGPINMMALEELSEIEERQDFLTTQKLDLEGAISDTQTAINEIRRRSREQFIEAFHKINDNFKQMFQELFGGGTGEMRLIDQNDLLESGIEIIAQPPGKRLQNVLLLSGGEKAMAALSLIMAIFRFRPSPFCLLDEVDAPLDEMNISRFSDKVLQMSSKTQFLIITHSKRTMEAARTLYGVTMEDPGVSKLISVKLS